MHFPRCVYSDVESTKLALLILRPPSTYFCEEWGQQHMSYASILHRLIPIVVISRIYLLPS